MNNSSFKAVLTCALISTGASSSAKEIDENTRMVITNFIFETMECVSFYSIVSSMENKSPKWNNLSLKYGNLAEEMGVVAFNLASQINLKPDVLMLKAQKYTNEMGELIGHDAANISLLLEKHGEFCNV